MACVTYPRTIKNWFRLSFGFVLSVTLSSCTMVPQGFKSTQVINLSPFAENTSALLSDLDFMLLSNDMVLLRDYFDPKSPDALKLDQHHRNIDELFRKIMVYSVGVVTLSNSKRTTLDKVKDYVLVLKIFQGDLTEALAISDLQFLAMLQKVETAPNLLAAFRQAQPLADGLATFVDNKIVLMHNLSLGISEQITLGIEGENSSFIVFMSGLEKNKQNVLEGLSDLLRYKNGDAAALVKLRKNIWLERVPKSDTLSAAQFKVLELKLLEQLERFDRAESLVSADVSRYYASHEELQRILKDYIIYLREIRLVMVTWVTAHRKMASGTVEPAAWFSLDDSAKLLFAVGKRALIK